MAAIAASIPTVRPLDPSEWPDDAPTIRLRRLRLRPTRRLALHLTLGLALYAGGANTSAMLVLLLAAMILGTIPWAWANIARAARHVDAVRRLPPIAVMGEPARAELWLRAPATGAAVVRDAATGIAVAVDDLAHGVHLSFSTALGRGEVEGGQVHVDLTDRFGLVRCCVEGAVPGRAVALPAVLPVSPGIADVAMGRTASAGGALRSAAGAETIGTREYRPGDRPRTVHWRATARHAQLVVRDLADDSRPRAQVVIGGGRWTQASLDRAAVVAATVAEHWAQAGLPTLVAADGRITGWGDAARRKLARLPPHVGAESRALALPPSSDSDILLTLGTDGERLTARIQTAGGTVELGALDSAGDREEVAQWLARWPRS